MGMHCDMEWRRPSSGPRKRYLVALVLGYGSALCLLAQAPGHNNAWQPADWMQNERSEALCSDRMDNCFNGACFACNDHGTAGHFTEHQDRVIDSAVGIAAFHSSKACVVVP